MTDHTDEYAFHESIPPGDWAILRADAVVNTLRAALSADLTASQPASGTEGQDEA